MRYSALVAACLGFALHGCSQEVAPLDPRNLERPVDIAFGCVGEHLLDSGDVVYGPRPVDDCVAGQSSDGDAGASVASSLYGFVLQDESGTLAVVDMTIPNQAGVVIDSDPLVPGKNSIPVATLPVSVVTDAQGCHLLTANAGTCDLSVVDMLKAVERDPSVTRRDVRNSNGDILAAKPADMIGDGRDGVSGIECPARPAGLVYVAYPHCNLVAVIDNSGDSGEIVAGIRFPESGPPEIVDGAVTCPAECGIGTTTTAGVEPDAGPSDADAGVAADAGAAADAGTADPDAGTEPPPADGPPRPVTLELARDGSQLYIGAENASVLTIVDLGADHLPTAVSTVTLEGDIGLLELAATGELEMGGALGSASYGEPALGTFSYVYAIATDRSIRVVEVAKGAECDTQVDPRFVHDSPATAELACFEVGSVFTPPRRAGASGPGIRLPRDSIPLDITTFDLATPDITVETPRAPATMVGHFAMVTTSDGFAYVVTVDDDHYPDAEDPSEPGLVDLPLALAHQLRDGVQRPDGAGYIGRNERPITCSVSTNSAASAAQFNVRASGGVFRVHDPDYVAQERGAMLPNGRTVECLLPDTSGVKRAPVSELDWGAPEDVHELAFPDVAQARNEEFLIVWEGKLSLDENSLDVDGPPVRVGVVLRDGNETTLIDGAAPFCALGAEPYDIVQLLGCSVDAQCSLDEECVFHPDSTVGSGLCMPRDLSDALIGRCRDLMISNKRYSVDETYAGHLGLIERRRVLRTTPLDGCTSDEQCQVHADLERELPEEPNLDEPERTWTCTADPSRAPGPDRCLMTCGEPQGGGVSTCEDGYHCSNGFCVEAPLPPRDCMQALQRYDVRAGEAFAVVGAALDSSRITGYVHNRIADPATGECIADPDGNPLLLGRIPLRAPECTGDRIDDVSPNPCSTTIDTGLLPEYRVVGDSCEEVDPETDDNGDPILAMVEVPAIRFRNPIFTMHLTQVSTTGDAVCPGDGALGLEPFSPVYPGFRLTMRIAGGALGLWAPINAAVPATIERGPRGYLWVLDRGDIQTGTLTNGRIIRVDPSQPANSFGVDSFAIIL